MNSPTDELVQRLLKALAGAGEGRVARLLAEAQAEAEAEVRTLLKSALKAALLHGAVGILERDAAVTGPAARGSAPDAAELRPGPQPEGNPPDVPPERGCYVYGVVGAGHPPLPADLAG